MLVAIAGACLAIAAVTHPDERGDSLPRRSPAVSGPLRIGMNLAGVSDWSCEWAFVDVFKPSRPWISQDVVGGAWDNGKPIEVNADGWPILRDPSQAAATLLCREIQGRYPGGLYVCTFDGKGTLRFSFDASVVRTERNRIELKVVPSDAGILLKIERSDPEDPVRNIKVWMPGFENAASAFHPLFVERLKPFKVIRFMDWGQTNDSTLVRWSDRTTPDSIRQSGPHGVALEHMIDLVNELGADPWFCMPHLADDGFVRSFAGLVKERLRPDRMCYVEWTNEAWNPLFAQGRWVREEAKRRGLSAQDVIADEALRDWRIWHEVFGPERSRVIRVAAGQHMYPGHLEPVLERLNGELDAVSCAAYFTARDEDVPSFDGSTTPVDVLKSALLDIDLRIEFVARHGALAGRWSAKLGRPIPLIAYEGGQHLSAMGGAPPYAAAYLEAQSHPAMYDAYRKMLSGFREVGGELYVAFSYVGRQSKWGSWGHLTYQDEPESAAPKWKALVDVAAEGRR